MHDAAVAATMGMAYLVALPANGFAPSEATVVVVDSVAVVAAAFASVIAAAAA